MKSKVEDKDPGLHEAEYTAAAIAAYWHTAGYRHVKVWVETICMPVSGPKTTGFVHCIRSNLINGSPPR